MNEEDQKKRERQVADFVFNLSQLDDGNRARLKRNAGKSLAESRDVQLLFYGRVLPRGIPEWQEERYFLLATLYPLDKAQRDRDRRTSGPDKAAQPAGSPESFGKSLRRARTEDNQSGLDSRFARLLDAAVDELPFHLRQVVKRLTNDWTPIDWAQLTKDILAWDQAGRRVQRRWARDYVYVAAAPHDQPLQTS